MSTTIPPASPRRPNRQNDADLFEAQPSSTVELPSPREMIERLGLVACEILAGLRSVDQIARWVTEDVYRTLAERSIAARRNHSRLSDSAPARPRVEVRSTRISEPRDGIVEGVVLLRVGARTRAMCIRLEGLDHRWRASAVALI